MNQGSALQWRPGHASPFASRGRAGPGDGWGCGSACDGRERDAPSVSGAVIMRDQHGCKKCAHFERVSVSCPCRHCVGGGMWPRGRGGTPVPQ